MSSKTIVEIEGPLQSNLNRIFEEENHDLLLKIFGRRTVLESTEATDQSSQNCSRKVSLRPESWRVVGVSDVLNWTTGQVDVTSSTEDQRSCLGFIRYRESPEPTEEALSFQDQLMLRGLSRTGTEFLWIQASREEGSNKGIKYKLTGKITSSSSTGATELTEVQIKTPSIDKIEYKAGNSQRPIMDSVMGSVDIGGLDQIVDALENNVGDRFKYETSIISQNILRLEEECRSSVETIEKLKLKLHETYEKTSEMKKIRGVQSNLQTAVEVVTNKIKLDKSDEDIFVDEDLNSSMTTNLDSPLFSSQESL